MYMRYFFLISERLLRKHNNANDRVGRHVYRDTIAVIYNL